MKINFVGNFQTGYVGEEADQVHLAREMEELGHTVIRIPQDEWREHVLDGNTYPNVPLNLTADINIITKWHHFDNGRFIEELKTASKAPVFYWVWDYMEDGTMPGWHIDNVMAADLYLGNDVRNPFYKDFKNCYYFPFDVADGDLPIFHNKEKLHNLVFFGSCIPQGDRISWITEINKTYRKVKIFSWNYEEWRKLGFDADPAVYGMEFNKTVAQSKIVLGFSVEPDAWGYWSNRVGKVMLAEGFLLYQYAPGMELFLRDGAEYFSSIDEANDKIDYFLTHDRERDSIALRGHEIAEQRFSSQERVKDLLILIYRYLQTNGKGWKL